MNSDVKERFAAEASPEVLDGLRKLADAQGRPFDALVNDALQDDVDRRQQERPRRHVMDAFASSTDEFDTLYQELAK